MKIPHAVLAGALLLLFGILAGSFYKTGHLRRLEAEADSIGRVRLEEQQQADALDKQRLEVIRLTHDELRQANEETGRISRRLEIEEQETATIQVVVNETNVGCPPEHIEADSLLALAHAREKASLRALTDQAEARADAWEMRYIATDVALDARTLECETCRQEVVTLREALNPGWFTRVRRSLVPTALTVLGTLLLGAAL